MPFGRCSIAHRSLFTLLPSTWCAAVAQPHRNLSGNALDLSPAAEPAATAWPNAVLPALLTTAAAEARRNTSRRDIPLRFVSDLDNSRGFISDLLFVAFGFPHHELGCRKPPIIIRHSGWLG